MASDAMVENSARIADAVTADSLRGLVERRFDAIHVPTFYPRAESAELSARIAGHQELEAYEIQNSLKRLGMGYVDVGGADEKAARYHSAAVRSIWDIRKIAYPMITPIDHLRLLLEEVWPTGATIETVGGEKCFVGTCRVIDPGAAMLPHNDRFGRMRLDGLDEMIGQLAINIYLQMPETGGELQLWLREPDAEQDERQRQTDGLDPAELGAPALTIRPENGDLVIFNSQLIHGVKPGEGNTQRVTMSFFVGYRGEGKPLSYWS